MWRSHILALLGLAIAGCADPGDTAQPVATTGTTSESPDAQSLSIRITGYELHGCSGTLVKGCVTASVNRAGANSTGWVIGVRCDTDPLCNISVGNDRVELYNLKAERLYSAGIGDLEPPPSGVAAFGMARIGVWPDETFTNSNHDVIPLAITKVTFGTN